MTFTKWQLSTIVIDGSVPIVVTLGFLAAKYFGKISKSLFLTYFFGAFIGAIWEIPFGIAGENFLMFKFHNPYGFFVHILHSFWDSILFLIGMYFIHIRNRGKYCGLCQLGLLISWGLISEFIIELLYNDKYWYYNPDNKHNPVVFTIHDVKYTCVPFLVWIVFPVLYLAGVFSIIEKYGPLVKDNDDSIILDDTEQLSLEIDNNTSYSEL